MSLGVINGEIWQRGLATLEAELDPQIFTAYIKPLRFSSYDESTAECEVLAPSSLVRNQVDRSFRCKLEQVLSKETGRAAVVRLMVDAVGTLGDNETAPPRPIVVRPTNFSRSSNASGSTSSSTSGILSTSGNSSSSSATNSASNNLLIGTSDATGGIGLNPRYTFSSFIVGNSNQFCHAAALRVAEQPGLSYNPLFIYGGVGLGKTHLLHAIGNSVLARNPTARVLYMSSETFTNELIQALRNARMEEFKQKMRNIEVLLIDDIQFMSGKERTQEEFFHTFNTLYNAKYQIVITSDKIPHEISGLEERLKTRFSWGLIADTQAPDYETRVAILRGRASAEGFEIPVEVAEYVAENISSNVRELEGAFTKLHAVSSLQGIPVTLELCRSALQAFLHNKSANISIDEIKKVVAEFFNIKISDMTSKRRTKNLSFPRHIAMYLCRKHTTASYPEIGLQFGGRDHSSVIHAANVVATKVAADNSVGAIISKLEQRLFAAHH